MNKVNIIGIKVDDRDDHAASVQKILTNYGNKINGRFGVPTSNKQDGVIALVMEADDKVVQNFTDDLRSVDGVVVSSMHI